MPMKPHEHHPNCTNNSPLIAIPCLSLMATGHEDLQFISPLNNLGAEAQQLLKYHEACWFCLAGVIWGFEGNLTDVLYNIWTYKIYIRVCALYIYNRYTLWMCSRYADTINIFLLSQYTFNWYLQTNPLDWNFSMEDNVNSIEQSFQWVYSLVHHPMRFFYLLSLFHNFHFYSSLLVQLQRKLDQWNLAWSPCNSAQRKPKLQAPRGTTFLLARLGIGKEAPWSQAGAGRRPRPIRHRWHGLKQVLGVNMGDLLRDLQWFTCS